MKKPKEKRMYNIDNVDSIEDIIHDEEKLMKYRMLEIKSHKPIMEILSYHKCKKCGKCCDNSDIYVGFSEYNKIKAIDKDIDSKGELRVSGFYLRSPCGYLCKDKKCKIYDKKPFVCDSYPFSHAYGTFVSLIACPLGVEIMKDIAEMNGKDDITFDTNVSGTTAKRNVEQIKKMNTAAGIDGGEPMDSALFTYDMLFMFSAYERRKYRWKKKTK